MTEQLRGELLEQMRLLGRGLGEHDDDAALTHRFLPLAHHARALETDVFLVVGDRGAGKTELFRAMRIPAILGAIRACSRSSRIPDPATSRWPVGYSTQGTNRPAAEQMEQFAQSVRSDAEVRALWLGLAVKAADEAGLASLSRPEQVCSATSPRAIADAARDRLDQCIEYLDATDVELTAGGKWAFLTYDDLDRLAPGDLEALGCLLRGLMQFWASHARRWSRLRPKVFIRKDILSRSALLGPDVSKLAASRVELRWSPRDLYALAARRLMGLPSGWRGYVGKLMPRDAEEHPDLGWLPSPSATAEAYRRFIEHMCGRFMGAGPTKGYTFTWIINHLQDAHEQAFPRSLLRFLEASSDIERENRRARDSQLLHHTSMREALNRVSDDRLAEIESEEYPWIAVVRRCIRGDGSGMRVPLEVDQLEKRLQTIDWRGEDRRPPDPSPRGIIMYLTDLGILFQRGDGKINVRDLYLYGFGFKRKGGVARASSLGSIIPK